MYGRMQFADFVVSSALQALSRSLLRIGEQNDQLQPGDEKALIQTAERLMSLWQMVQWSVGKLHFARAQADLREIIELSTGNRKPEVAAAERILDKAEGKSRRILGEIVLELSTGSAVPQSPDRLNALLQAESRRWRELGAIRQIDRDDLVDHGMLRAFNKARDLNGKLDRNLKSDAGRPVSAKRLMRAGRWVRHSVNHLELLRPALSETGRTRRWHLNRLATKLDEQWALERFARLTVVVEAKPKASARLGKLLQAERRRLEKQRSKLSIGAFAGNEKSYRIEVVEAVDQLALEAITLLPLQKEIG